ncbi:hypothetical protein LTR36_000644 [Oleoguttula mirabilis]|uniref:RING-CH-type domain-containing protein n=1 Tax=Oleoguttula mirabilis TaxID=1507867 RepID=A0AAV9JQL1_9PEZI|nr:hypothetical protein LTR36_000644 [Oleoguttula mirabilis]
MASLPPRQQSQSQRRTSSDQSPDHSQSQAPASPEGARSATSEDSQTLFLNSPHKEEEQQSQQQQHTPAPPAPPYRNIDDDPDVNKCWICFSDSTEDTPETSPWRDPCPCALVAHEECLLDWIADMEAPKNSRNRPIGGPKIQCPQCKSEIKLARPRNYVVDAVRGLERVGAKAITPAALTVLSATLYNSSMAWGVHSIYSVFGSEDGFRILRPLILNAMRPPVETYVGEPREALQKVMGVVLDHLVHWRLYIGLPLITPVLVLSRTKFADSVLPVLPILFFATQHHLPEDRLDFRHWPPSASLAFAILPYVRSAYNLYYEKVWAQREKRWLKSIQPRNGQGQNDADADGGLANPDHLDPAVDEDDNIFEVRIDGGIWDDWGDEDPGQPQPDAQINRAAPPPMPEARQQDGHDPAQPPPNIIDDRDFAQQQPPPNIGAPPLQQQQQQPQQPPQNNNIIQPQGERRLSFSPTAIAESVLGALLFPTIAGMSGELLKLLLPRAWTTISPLASSGLGGGGGRFSSAARGLLREKWARSLVGGCLFVVAKDAVVLYVRWKMARMHRGRRVLDWEGSGKGARGRRVR